MNSTTLQLRLQLTKTSGLQLRTFIFAAVAVLALPMFFPASARANYLDDSVLGDYSQNRGMGGLGTASVYDNSAIVVNPAGLSQSSQYSIGAVFSKYSSGYLMGLSVADSKTSPFSMGVDYRYRRADDTDFFPYWRRQEIHVGVSEFYGQKVHLGFNYHYSKVSYPLGGGNDRLHNFGLGLVIPATSWLRFGVAALDVLKDKDPSKISRLNLGTALNFRNIFTIYVDGVWHWLRGKQNWTIATGAEVVIKDAIALRGGYHQNLKTGDLFWSAGAGWFFFGWGHVGYAILGSPKNFFEHTVSLEVYLFKNR